MGSNKCGLPNIKSNFTQISSKKTRFIHRIQSLEVVDFTWVSNFAPTAKCRYVALEVSYFTQVSNLDLPGVPMLKVLEVVNFTQVSNSAFHSGFSSYTLEVSNFTQDSNHAAKMHVIRPQTARTAATLPIRVWRYMASHRSQTLRRMFER